MRREDSPHDTVSGVQRYSTKKYQPSSQCGRVRTENVLLHCPMYFITTFAPCQELFAIFSFYFFASPYTRRIRCDEGSYDIVCDILHKGNKIKGRSGFLKENFSIVHRFARKIRQKIVYFGYCLFLKSKV